MKTPKTTPETNTSKASDALVGIAEIVLKFRDGEKPTLSTIARVTGRAAGLLRLDSEHREQIANSAALQLAKRHNLLGTAG